MTSHGVCLVCVSVSRLPTMLRWQVLVVALDLDISVIVFAAVKYIALNTARHMPLALEALMP